MHRTLLAALLRTFVAAPVGSVTLDPRAGLTLLPMASGIFAAAIQLSAPVMAATLVAEMAVALGGQARTAAACDGHDRPDEDAAGYGALIGSLALWPAWIEARFTALLDAAGRLLAGAART